MKKIIHLMPLLFIFMLFFVFRPSSLTGDKNDIYKPLGEPKSALLNINNLAHWMGSNGVSAHNPYTNDDGIIYPRNTANVVYIDGLVWGGKVYDGLSPQLRVGGSTYKTGLMPGAILGIRTGNVENHNDPNVRIWRVRRDWETADFSTEIKEQHWSLTTEQIRQQYQTDWNGWPATKGAPFEDVDQDGVYNPQIDIPGIPGSDQTIWYTANDIYGESIYGSPSIGLEMQTSLWAYKRLKNDPFGDIVFKHVRLIYKGTANTPAGSIINDMYISQWADPDIGSYINDFVGCDSLYSIGFAYNGSPTDGNFSNYNLPPPAFGYILLHGPHIYSPGDTAIINFTSIPNYKNLPMSSFFYFSAGGPDIDPPLNIYTGTTEWYNLMLGLRPQTGQPWINPLNGKQTLYPLAGNPILGEGWIDGISYPAGDRRMGITSGPFNMALGDTQEVILALIGEIGNKGPKAYLNNINGMKNKAKSVKGFLRNNLAVTMSAESLVPVSEKTHLQASYLLFYPTLTINDIVWEIKVRPEGSNSVISEITADSVYFIPDLEGLYQISITVSSVEGISASNTIEIHATTNKPPVADYTLDPTTIVLGESLLADASATYDPEGDSIEFKWNISTPMSGQGYGNITLVTMFENGKMCYLQPTGTGKYTLQLTVSDGIFENDTIHTFNVTPKLENISLVYSFLDTSWFRTNRYYFHEHKLLMAIEPLNIVRIYNLDKDNISIERDLDIHAPVRVYKIEDNLLYIGISGFSGYWGPGPLNIYQIYPDWEIKPVLENYLPGSSDIYNLHFTENHVYTTDNSTVYIIDFQTNPSSPQILADRGYGQRPICFPNITGPYFYVRVYEYPENRIEVLSKTSLDYVSDLSMPAGWKTLSTYDTLMFIGFYDSLQIHSVADPLQPIKLSSIVIPPSFDWVFSLNYHILCSGSYIQNSILAVTAGVGIVYYDIADPSNPVQMGAWYGGRDYVSTYKNNDEYYLAGFDVSGSCKDTYFGFNKVNLDFLNSIPQVYPQKLPEAYTLHQNHPNPFNPSTTICYALPKAGDLELEVFNILGQKVATLVNEHKAAGNYEVIFNAGHLASGVYYYRIQAGTFSQVRKMLLVR